MRSQKKTRSDKKVWYIRNNDCFGDWSRPAKESLKWLRDTCRDQKELDLLNCQLF